MFWVLCSGAPWRDLPERYSSWKTVYNRFNRWSKSGVINTIFKRLLSLLDANGLVDWSATALDGTKIHLATDAGCLPLNIVLSPGQAHESQLALRLLDGIGVPRQNGSMKRRGHVVLANKDYSEHALRNELKRKGIKVVIPRKSNEKMASDGRLQLDHNAYRNRNVVERCIGRLKEYRRIVTRYDKTARNYLSMVKLGCIQLFYKKLCN